jgi:DNA-binding transcriptional MerR regulator
MDDDGSLQLTIGQLASRTGLPVRTIRYWSDIGAVPPAGRSPGGRRSYDAESVARLELVRTLRDLGLGLQEVRRVLAGRPPSPTWRPRTSRRWTHRSARCGWPARCSAPWPGGIPAPRR